MFIVNLLLRNWLNCFNLENYDILIYIYALGIVLNTIDCVNMRIDKVKYYYIND